jgi:hypothetical protein
MSIDHKMKPTKTIHDVGEQLGIKREVTDQILIDIRDNNAKLEACPRHDFSICIDRRTKHPLENPTPAQTFGCRLQCSKCCGHVDSLAKNWYQKGLNHSSWK